MCAGLSTGGPPLQFVVRSIGDYRDIVDVMLKIEDAARKSGLFIFTDSDLKFDTPQYEFKIDAAKANRLGISMQEVAERLLAEGLQLFSDAFDKLLDAVEKQSRSVGAGKVTSVPKC